MDGFIRKPLIIAHRGASLTAPENTIAAFSRAVEDGAEGIEFDVRLTRDGVPVVFHDASLKRIAGVEKRISAVSLAELAQFDAGTWFNRMHSGSSAAKFENERVPTLEDTLEFLKVFRGPIYIELKSTARSIRTLAESVAEVLSRFSGSLKVIVKSFDFEVVKMVRAISPGVETAALFAPSIMQILRKESMLIKIAKETGFTRLSLHFSLASRKLMEIADSEKIPVTIWTADSPRWIKRSIDLGIDSLITNDPRSQLAVRNKAFAKR